MVYGEEEDGDDEDRNGNREMGDGKKRFETNGVREIDEGWGFVMESSRPTRTTNTKRVRETGEVTSHFRRTCRLPEARSRVVCAQNMHEFAFSPNDYSQSGHIVFGTGFGRHNACREPCQSTTLQKCMFFIPNAQIVWIS